MESYRLPRFKRSTDIAAIRITERDREIIRLVHRHRFLRSSHIVALVGGSTQQILRRLQLLYHHGFLERPPAQLNYYHEGGSRSIAYGLGNKGAAVLKGKSDSAIQNTRWNEKNQSVGRVFLEHALLVSQIMVSIELACSRSGHVRLLSQSELFLPVNSSVKKSPFRWRVNLRRGVKLGLAPDRVFALEISDSNKAKNSVLFFLEADRGTMPVTRRNLSQTSFYRKLLAYEATWAQSLHKTRFGFPRFRVLTVTTSPARVKSILDACLKLERGHGLFLFTDIAGLNTSTIFTSIWHTPKQSAAVSLLD